MRRPTVSLLALLASSVVSAETTEEASREQAPVEWVAVESLDSPDPHGATALESVTIRGERLGQDLTHSSTSAEVIGGAAIDRGTSQDFHELVGSLGNVTRAKNDRQIAIRGILQNGNGGGDSETISVYLDGIALPQRAANFGGPLNAFDLEQIEVLRGAQSTSQGRNALGGAVFIQTRDAQPFWEAQARAGLGEHNGRQWAAAVGGPLFSDALSFRLAFEQNNSDGEIRNVTRGTDDAGRQHTRMGRLKLRYAPFGSPYSAQLLGVQSNNAFGDNVFDASQGPRTETANERYHETYRSQILGLTQALELNGSWSLHATSGLADGVDHRDADFDRTEAVGGTSTFDLDDHNLSQELRADFHGEQLTAVLGLYGARLEQYSLVTGADVLVGGGSVLLDGFVRYDRSVETAAAFGELEWRWLPDWSLTAGLRRQYERFVRHNVSDVAYRNAQTGAPIPDAAVEALNELGGSPLLPAAVVEQLEGTGFLPLPEDYDVNGDTGFHVWLPKAALRWQYLAEHSAALTWSRGYRSGGTSVSFFGGVVNDYDPETTATTELALRSRWPRARLRLNLNLFHTRWRNQQVEVGNSVDYYTVIQNAGRSTLQGAELSGEWRPDTRFGLSASLGWLETRYEEFRNLDQDYAGNEFNYAPRFSGGITADWQAAQHWQTQLNLTHTGAYYGDPGNRADQRVPARTLINARLGYRWQDLELALIGRNLSDELNEQDRFELRNRQARRYGEPRTISVQLDWRFGG